MSMNALVYDTATGWETSRGLRKALVPRPILDEAGAEADWALVKLRYAGFCGSDRSIWYRSAFRDLILDSLQQEGKSTRITGHELLGEVVQLGARAGRDGLREGTVVAAESHIVCGHCYPCQTGQAHVCTNERILGISVDGCFAEYLKVPAAILWPTDLNAIDVRVAAVQEPFGNAVHLCSQAEMRGKDVVVLGCGTIGLFSILIARQWGARHIIGVDPNPRQRQMAEACGADQVFCPPTPPAAGETYSADPQFSAQLRAQLPRQGADVVLEVAGMNSSVNLALALARRGGTVMLFGIRSGTFSIPDFEKIILNGLELRAVVGRQLFQTWHHTQALLEQQGNGIQQKVLEVILNRGEGTVLPFDQFEPASFEASMKEHPKLVLRF
jgi:threonine 3-dehydrogenase